MNVVPLQQPGVDSDPAPTFQDFYDLFPRHEARKDAAKAWSQLADDAERLAAVVGAAAWRKILLERHERGFCPLAASYLRGERYRDELPVAATSSHASHQPATSTPLPARTGMPESVRALLAKLRGGK